MSAAFHPRSDREQAREWLRRRLDWENVLAALRAAQRVEAQTVDRDLREPAAA
jgi:plasmid stability protein